MNYNESSEDYLEAILMLREQLGKVRSIDIVYKYINSAIRNPASALQ